MIIFNKNKLKLIDRTDKRLRIRSEEVKEFDKTLSDLAKAMTKLMKSPLNDGVDTVGISAVQIGINIRLCICQNPNTGQNVAMVNPELIEASDEKSKELEGCLSVGTGPNQLFGYVHRSKRVKFKYYTLKGQEALLEVKDLYSHIVQHEIDHMDGKLFIDYFSDLKGIMTLSELNLTNIKKNDL